MAIENLTINSRRTVVGYFANGEDAHRAINDLLENGFRPSEIGAAFHTAYASASGGTGNSTIATGTLAAGKTTAPGTQETGTSTAGAASDSNAVTPAGLSTGGGTVTSGAVRPGPIPGAEIPDTIPSTLPHTIQSTLPSTLHPNPNAPLPTAGVRNDYPATGGIHETRRKSSPDWWEKLKHVFGTDSETEAARRQNVVDKTSTNFGTGEGHIGAYPDYDYAYSGAAFESAFFGMGIPPDHSRMLSNRIRRGGAIVTVETARLGNEAEEILERNFGSVRYEDSATAPLTESVNDVGGEEERVQLFGRVQNVYPGYISSAGVPTRKAS